MGVLRISGGARAGGSTPTSSTRSGLPTGPATSAATERFVRSFARLRYWLRPGLGGAAVAFGGIVLAKVGLAGR